MTKSRADQSPAAYDDVKFVMDLALKKPGLIYECKRHGTAVSFKLRCNKYRNLLREIAQEQVGLIPGHRAETVYDKLVIRQTDDEGNWDAKGRRLVFDHRAPLETIIDPETGEELDPFNHIKEV